MGGRRKRNAEWRERKMGRREKGVGQRREAEREEKGKKISFYGLHSSQNTLFKKKTDSPMQLPLDRELSNEFCSH